MSAWPLELVCSGGRLQLPGPGHYALVVREGEEARERLVDELLGSARTRLDGSAVAWMPENGGLLSNLPAWENVLLSTQWHAPASLAAMEKRVRGWCGQLGYDTTALSLLLSRPPAFLDENQRLLVGWLRQLLSRPRLVLMRPEALPANSFGLAMRALLEEDLSGAALLVIDESVPVGFERVMLEPTGMSQP